MSINSTFRCGCVIAVSVLSMVFGCGPRAQQASQNIQGVADSVSQRIEKAQQATATTDLTATYSAYSSYSDGFAKGPANWDALIDFVKKSNGDTAPLERVKERGTQITWGADMGRLPNGLVGTVFAQGGGGPTMMFDGSVK